MTLRSTKVQFALVLAILFCIVIAIWLPFSFNISPIWDVWGTYQGLDTGQTPLIRVDVEAMRPFTNIAWYLAYAIDSTSFVGITVVLITMLVAKGGAFFLVIRRLFPHLSPVLALTAAAIATAHPGDPHALYAGAIGGHLGIFLFFMSVYFLLVFVDNGRWPILAAALGCSLFSMGFSERTYPMILLIPLLVVYKTGRLNRRAITAIGWWLASALPVFALYAVSFLSDSYRRLDRVEGGTLNPFTLLERTLHAIHQIFVEGWIPPSANIPSSWLVIALVVGLASTALIVFFQRNEAESAQTPPHRLLLLISAGGLVVLVAGFAAFAPLEQYGTALRRALYLSVFGGALTLASLLYLLTSYLPAKRYIFAVSTGIVVGLGILNLQFQQQYEYNFAIAQHTRIATIIETVPAPRSDSVLFIAYRDIKAFRSTPFAISGGFPKALSLVYGYSVRVCTSVPELESGCELTSEGLRFKRNNEDEQPSSPSDLHPYEKVIAIRFGERNGTVVMNPDQFIEFAPDNTIAEQIAQSYRPQSLYSPDDPLPARYYTMLLPQATVPLSSSHTAPLTIDEIALSSFSNVIAPQGSVPFVSIEGEGLTASEHLRYPQQNTLETDGEHSWLWLGDGVEQGMTLYLQADAPVMAQLALTVQPGPSRREQTRTLEIQNLQTGDVTTLTFDEQTTATSEIIPLDAGLNPIQITVMETPDNAATNGDPRSLLVLLDSLRVTTRP